MTIPNVKRTLFIEHVRDTDSNKSTVFKAVMLDCVQ